MNSARAALEDGEVRHAVMEAASACEIVITAALKRRLARGDTRVGEALMERTRMLGPLTQLASRLGLAVPAGFQGKLIELRNDAIHKGRQLGRGAVSKAVETAEQLVSLHAAL
jgi:hypothetical protein